MLHAISILQMYCYLVFQINAQIRQKYKKKLIVNKFKINNLNLTAINFILHYRNDFMF